MQEEETKAPEDAHAPSSEVHLQVLLRSLRYFAVLGLQNNTDLYSQLFNLLHQKEQLREAAQAVSPTTERFKLLDTTPYFLRFPDSSKGRVRRTTRTNDRSTM